MPPFNVLIIGAGKIGAFYDTPASAQILTHAHAFAERSDFRISGFVDADMARAERAAGVWGGKAYSQLDTAFAEAGPVSVVCVAVPDEFHREILEQLAAYEVALIVAEKPFTQSAATAADVLRLYQDKTSRMAVNYTRRYLTAFHKLRQAIHSGRLGKLLQGTGYYGKGSIHNGSHLFNLLLFLFKEVRVVNSHSRICDFQENDPSASGWLEVDHAPFAVQAVDSRAVTLFEMNLMFENQRVRMLDSGAILEFSEVRDDPVINGYRRYFLTETVETNLFSALPAAVENYAQVLRGAGTLLSPVDDAVATLQLCERLLRS